MRTATAALATVAMAAAAVSAAGEQAVYWGQNDSERDLASYCATKEGIDIVVLSFLANYGNGVTPNGNFGNSCSVDSNGNGSSGCSSLATTIQNCKNAGKKVFISIGGGGAGGSLGSNADGQGVAWSLWNQYANPQYTDKSAPRPFGNVFVDGWDLDIENSNGHQYYAALITALRKNFASDPNHKYYISGAPQCPYPDANMGDSITNAVYDYLFIQFYNNPYCSAYQEVRPDSEKGPNGGFNFDYWYQQIQGGQSKNAKLLIGLPASTQASGYSGEPGSKFYIKPDGELPTIINKYKSHAGFGGVMLWDAGNSDIGKNNAGCTYDQAVKALLSTGNPCTNPSTGGSSGGSTTMTTSTKTASKTSTAPTSTATCSWAGHCAGASCSNENDCSDDLVCNNGVCGH